jgi:hypothetical protein
MKPFRRRPRECYCVCCCCWSYSKVKALTLQDSMLITWESTSLGIWTHKFLVDNYLKFVLHHQVCGPKGDWLYIQWVYQTLGTPSWYWVAVCLFALRTVSIHRHELHKVSSIPQWCWPMLTPMLPTVASSWLGVLWVVDHSWYRQETVECGKTQQGCSSWHKPVRLAPTITLFKSTYIFPRSQSPSEWHT